MTALVESAAPPSTSSAWPCPLCGGASRRWLVRHGYGIRRCPYCDHRFAELVPDPEHARQVYGDDYFTGGGAGYTDYQAEAPLHRARGRDYARLLAQHRPPGSVLDVGAAAGYLLDGWREAGWRGAGIEPNASMAAVAREKLGLDVRAGTLEGNPRGDQFDVISLVQVLPHFVDPRQALAQAAQRTAPGGYWLIETWNVGSWSARAWGRWWHEYSPPSVLHWFTPERIARLAGEFGFREVARGRPRRKIQLDHARSLALHALGGGRLAGTLLSPLGWLPSGWSVPYPGDDLFWILLAGPTE